MALHFLYTTPADPLARALVDELTWEYDRRYGEFYAVSGEPPEMQKYAPEVFTPAKGGNFVLLLDGGEPVSGGAFKRHGPYTAELKRVWTHSRRRRQGLAQRVVVELEAQAWRQGYRSIYLTTGFRQPEAVALYRRAGYTALYDADGDLQAQRKLPFRKDLLDVEVTRYEKPTAEARA
ncbi:MAG: GNAT family N-acetyltransferase [Rubrivivax sp.]